MKLKKITYFALAFLLSMPAVSYAHKLDMSKIDNNILLRTFKIEFDGGIIDGLTYGQIKRYLMNLRVLLIGRVDNGKRIGHFSYNGKQHSVTELVALENEMNDDQRTELLTHMRKHFEEFSTPFQQSVKRVKGVLKDLILQSSKIRNSEYTLLLKWSDPSVDDDHALFDQEVRTIEDFRIFLTDLYSFLFDLMQSCPKGEAKYKQLLAQKLAEQAQNKKP